MPHASYVSRKTKRPSFGGRSSSDFFCFVRAPFLSMFRDGARVLLALLEVLLVQFKYLLVVRSIFLTGRAGITLMLPVRIHLSLFQIVGLRDVQEVCLA